MPRPRVPKLSLHKGTGQARVLLAGKQVYLGKYGAPEADAKYRRLIAEYLRTGEIPPEAAPAGATRTPGAGNPTARTVGEIILAYWKWATGHYVKDGQPTSEIGVLKRKDYRDQLARDGLSRPGVNERVKRVFKWPSPRS